ncbi:MAG: tRNA(adenine34) deaminase [Kiritimatiellia bacterium]|jgi:tRNA(adenine34) deaminase
MDPEIEHADYMRQVMQLACQNLKRPFASLIVDSVNGEVVSEGLNKNYHNPIMHSELVAITEAVKNCEDPDWPNFVLYTTAEPNTMSISGILWAGIGKVVYGSSLATLNTLGYRHIGIPAAEVVERAVDLKCELVGGILEKECNEIFAAAMKLEKAGL